MPPAAFEWHGVEYEHSQKSADWYWAVGIIATALVIASALFGNYLLALLVFVAAAVVAVRAIHPPPTHRFVLDDRGLLIDRDLFPFERMHSFAILEYLEGDRPLVLSIKNDSWFAPHLVIPLNGIDADALYAHLLARVNEGEHKHSLHEMVAAWLGF